MNSENVSRTRRNDDVALAALRASGPVTRLELASLTGLAPSTLTGVLVRLEERGMVRVSKEAAPGRGRPARLFHFTGQEGRTVLVSVGRESVEVSALDADANRQATATVAFDRTADDGPADAVRRALDEAGIEDLAETHGDVVVATVSFPVHQGRRSKRTGRLPEGLQSRAKSLPRWIDANLAELLSAAVGMTVHLENDANLAALGEARYGAGKESVNFIHIDVVDGLGAGIVINTEVVQGAAGFAGEIAHTHVNDDGPACVCGSFGCFSTQTSIYSIIETIKPAFEVEDLSLHDMAELASLGDEVTLRALHTYGEMIGRFVANACVILNPELITVDSRLGAAGEPLRHGIRDALSHFAPGVAAEAVQIVPAQLRAPQLHGALVLGNKART